MRSIERLVNDELSRFFLEHSIDPVQGILVAFSGGSDSLGLLYGLSKLVPEGRLHAAYVNHRMRPDSELVREIARNRENCERLGVPLDVLDLGRDRVARAALDRKLGSEEAARTLRYDALRSLRRSIGYRYIATAHTSDDQLETLLMRLLQGGDPASMRGVSEQNGCVIRPVLALDRNSLRALLVSVGFSWVEDSTNEDDRYLRNRIRHRLVPAVLEVFPSAKASAYVFAKKSAELARFVDDASSAVAQHVSRMGAGVVKAQIEPIASLPEYLMLGAVYRMWNLLQGDPSPTLSYGMARRVLALFRDENGRVVRACRTTAKRQGDLIVWRKDVRMDDEAFAVSVGLSENDRGVRLVGGYSLERNVPETLQTIPEGELYVPEGLLVPPLLVRSWHEGDRITLSGGEVSVSKLVGQWKLPASEAKLIPVLEDRSGIVAVLGKRWGGKDRLAARFRVGPLAPIRLSHYSIVKRKECSEQ